jgi:hypothetical protein
MTDVLVWSIARHALPAVMTSLHNGYKKYIVGEAFVCMIRR